MEVAVLVRRVFHEPPEHRGSRGAGSKKGRMGCQAHLNLLKEYTDCRLEYGGADAGAGGGIQFSNS
jgi:hypothetical protein